LAAALTDWLCFGLELLHIRPTTRLFCFLLETPVTARNIGLLFQLGSVLTAQLLRKLIATGSLARGTHALAESPWPSKGFGSH
jgi:hypothetical protein